MRIRTKRLNFFSEYIIYTNILSMKQNKKNDISLFNKKDTINTTEQTVNIVVDNGFSLNQSNFISSEGGSMTGNLSMLGNSKILFYDGSSQVRAFSENNVEQLSGIKNITENMSVNNGQLRINQSVKITGDLDIPPDSLNQNRVIGLVSELGGMNNLINQNVDDIVLLKEYNENNDVDINLLHSS